MSSEVQVRWIGPALQHVGVDSDGQRVALDHVLSGEQREETGIRPMRLVLLGMAGCSSMDVVSIMQKKRQDLAGLEVTVSAERAEDHPRVYTRVHLEYVARGTGVDLKALERSVQLSVTKYCSAIAMVAKTAEITTSCRIEEDMSETTNEQIAGLEQRIAELKARLPKHSPPMSMLVELDELDEALEEAKARAGEQAGS